MENKIDELSESFDYLLQKLEYLKIKPTLDFIESATFEELQELDSSSNFNEIGTLGKIALGVVG